MLMKMIAITVCYVLGAVSSNVGLSGLSEESATQTEK